MSKIALSPNASGTGVFTIASPNGNTDRTLVLPDEAGTVLTTAGVPASAMPAGSVIQVVQGYRSPAISTTSTSWTNVTDASATITPSSASNKILVLVTGNYISFSTGIDGRGEFAVVRNTSTTTIADCPYGWYFSPDITSDGNTYGGISMSFLDSPNSTSPLTYDLQFHSIAGAYLEARRVAVTVMEVVA